MRAEFGWKHSLSATCHSCTPTRIRRGLVAPAAGVQLANLFLRSLPPRSLERVSCPKVKTLAKRVLVQSVGWIFILIGIVGLFLPILQGVLFLLIGLMILSTEYVWAHHLLRRIRQRFPKVSDKVDQAAQKASEWLRRMAGHTEVD